jgi:hypothetical protein
MREPDAPKTPEVPDDSKPAFDSLTGALVRPLDYADALDAFVPPEWGTSENRYRASSLGRCLRYSYYSDTNTPMDDGAEGFPKGIGERGNAVEDRITLILRAVHGHDSVLQNLTLTKRLIVKHPKTGANHEIAIVAHTDPVIIGENLSILALYEIKTKGWFSEEMKKWPKQGMNKVPLYMAGIDEEKTSGTKGAASLNNALQLAFEARVLRDEGREAKQPLLTYVLPDNFKTQLQILFSPTDVTALSDLAMIGVLQRAEYKLKGEVPPPLYAMGWECNEKVVDGKKVAWCPWKKRCDEQVKDDGKKPRLNPLYGDVNGALARARKNAKAGA